MKRNLNKFDKLRFETNFCNDAEIFFSFNSASAENIIDADFIHCFCFDSGNFKTLSLDKIRTLPNQFRQMPKLAMKAKLYGKIYLKSFNSIFCVVFFSQITNLYFVIHQIFNLIIIYFFHLSFTLYVFRR
jgi:hypothetical protein